jgi:putative FmdB family regulatory protein
MPIYEYVCSACAARTEILHGIHDAAPAFCPECGAEGTLRKGIVASAVVFKGSGWAKKDRRATPSTARPKDGDGKDASSDTKAGEAKSADSGKAAPSESGSGSGSEAASSGSASGSSSAKPPAPASEGA